MQGAVDGPAVVPAVELKESGNVAEGPVGRAASGWRCPSGLGGALRAGWCHGWRLLGRSSAEVPGAVCL